jgi:hypothetical protein
MELVSSYFLPSFSFRSANSTLDLSSTSTERKLKRFKQTIPPGSKSKLIDRPQLLTLGLYIFPLDDGFFFSKKNKIKLLLLRFTFTTELLAKIFDLTK